MHIYIYIYTSSWYMPGPAYNCKCTRSLMSYAEPKYTFACVQVAQKLYTMSAQGS